MTTDASGNASFTVTFQVAVPLMHVITATATDSLGNSSEFSGRQPNDSFGETANLSVTKSDEPDPVLAGQLLSYTIAVTNNGPDDATNVILIDTLPSGVKFQSATSSQGVFGLIGANSVFGNLGSIASGSTVMVQVSVLPTTTGTITNSVTVASDQLDPDTTNNSASTTTTVNPAADLVVNESAIVTGEVGLGSHVEFVITVTNNGLFSAAAAAVTDDLPDALTFSSFGSGVAGTLLGTTLSWNFGTLNSGESATVSYFVVANELGTIVNRRRSPARLGIRIPPIIRLAQRSWSFRRRTSLPCSTAQWKSGLAQVLSTRSIPRPARLPR